MEHVNCNLCGSSETIKLFSKNEKFGISEKPFDVVECSSCGLAYVNPRPEPKDIGSYYPETYSWNESLEAASCITKLIRKLEKSYRYHLLKYEVLKVIKEYGKDRGKILDVGCGSGDRLDIFRNLGFETYGVETSQAAEYAQNHMNLDVKRTDIFGAEYPSEYFDIITLHNVLEHTHDPKGVVNELRRIVKKDGIIVIQVPNTLSFQFKLFKKRWAAVDVPRDLYYFNTELLRKLFSDQKCHVSKVDHSNNFWHPPTLVISLFPSLDPQLSWRDESSRLSSYIRRILWGIMTLAVSPAAKFESTIGKGAIITIYAGKMN